jgi:FkbM family methyltransferase
MNSHSQYGEDVIINQFFPEGYKGICIDVGAVDGLLFSNTYRFEKNGWFCICCEANPEMYEKLKMNRLEAVHGAIGSQDLLEVYFNVVNLIAKGGNENAVSAVTIDERLLREHEFLNPKIRKVNVPMFTLDTVLLKYPALTHIDFLSIDTEGTELEVLKGFDMVRWKPKLLVIDNTFGDPEIEDYLYTFGYTKVRRLVETDFYIKE